MGREEKLGGPIFTREKITSAKTFLLHFYFRLVRANVSREGVLLSRPRKPSWKMSHFGRFRREAWGKTMRTLSTRQRLNFLSNSPLMNRAQNDPGSRKTARDKAKCWPCPVCRIRSDEKQNRIHTKWKLFQLLLFLRSSFRLPRSGSIFPMSFSRKRGGMKRKHTKMTSFPDIVYSRFIHSLWIKVKAKLRYLPLLNTHWGWRH